MDPDNVDGDDKFFSIRFGEDDWMQAFDKMYGAGIASSETAVSNRPVRVTPLQRATDDRIHDTGFVPEFSHLRTHDTK